MRFCDYNLTAFSLKPIFLKKLCLLVLKICNATVTNMSSNLSGQIYPNICGLLDNFKLYSMCFFFVKYLSSVLISNKYIQLFACNNSVTLLHLVLITLACRELSSEAGQMYRLPKCLLRSYTKHWCR